MLDREQLEAIRDGPLSVIAMVAIEGA